MDAPPQKKYCLLIIQQSFHSFAGFLKEALAAKGYEVHVANDIYPASMMGTVLGKLQIPLIFKTTYGYITKNYLAEKKYEVAIIIRGRGVSKQLIAKMSETVPRIIGYNWDTFNFNAAPLAWYSDVNRYYTFDYADAERYHLPVLELFSALPETQGVKIPKYDVSAVGKNYPGRLKYINRVLGVLNPQRVLIRLHENNVFDLLLNFFKHPALYIKYRKHISLRPLSNTAYLDAVGAAEFTIDYANNGQTGITMRCYEAISLQTKLITNNSFIKQSTHFNETNTIVFTDAEADGTLQDTYDMCRKKAFIKNNRGINRFLNDLLK
jgi:hypothetical protein